MRNIQSKSRGRYIAKGIVFGIVAAAAFTFALMLLWNWLMPLIFGLTVLTFWQALGLLALSKIIFGSGRHSRQNWQEREKSKMHREQFGERFKKAKAMYHNKTQDDDNTQQK